jgi:hypothetical protein
LASVFFGRPRFSIITGRVRLRFNVSEIGQIGHVEVLESTDEGLEKHANLLAPGAPIGRRSGSASAPREARRLLPLSLVKIRSRTRFLRIRLDWDSDISTESKFDANDASAGDHNREI